MVHVQKVEISFTLFKLHINHGCHGCENFSCALAWNGKREPILITASSKKHLQEFILGFCVGEHHKIELKINSVPLKNFFIRLFPMN